MSTQIVALTALTWTKVYTGPTSDPLAVEKKSGSPDVWLAISTAIPTFSGTGHLVQHGAIKNVTLGDGEILYAYCGQAPGTLSASLVVTD
jgi:hypothetical protein